MARTKTDNKTAAVKKPVAKVSIPSVTRPDTSKEAQVTGLDLLSEFTANVKAKETSSKPERPKLTLPEVTQALFVQNAMASVLEKHFSDHSKNLGNSLKSELYPLWIKTLWQNKSQPDNPTLETVKVIAEDGTNRSVPDCRGQFQVKNSFKVEAKTAEDLKKVLIQADFDEKLADKIVRENVRFDETISIDFTVLQYGKANSKGEWVESTPEEKAAANHALKLLSGVPHTPVLSPDEKQLIIEKKSFIRVTSGFLDRICGYIETKSEEKAIQQLTLLLSIFKPQLATRGEEIGLSDTLMQRNERLIQGAREIIGLTEDDDRRYAEKVLGLDTTEGRTAYARKVLGM